MCTSLDTNVLIALLDQDHAFHARAHAWWRKDQPPWASCPLTENGVVRIMASPSYSRARPFTIAELVNLLQTFTARTKHIFWPDSVSILDATRFDHGRILLSETLTDIYLLSLAVEKGGRLVTFDQGIATSAVARAAPKNLLVV
jgi:toxin-antitoxin system PIN domain toxin